MKALKITRLQYIGLRSADLFGNKMVHAFLHKGVEVYFSRIRNLSIGCWYEGTMRDGSPTIYTRPPMVDGPEATDAQMRLWAASHEACLMTKAKRRVDAKTRSIAKSKLKDALAPLQEIYGSLGINERMYFSDVIAKLLQEENIKRLRALDKAKGAK